MILSKFTSIRIFALFVTDFSFENSDLIRFSDLLINFLI